ERNILVPVLLDAVVPPLGFGELQAVDLANWRGDGSDPFFKDLIAAVQAKLDGQDAPPAKGPVTRLYRRLRAARVATLAAGCSWGLAISALGVQDQLWGEPLGQPLVSDVCGGAGLGHRPRHDERVAWDRRPPGDCDGLRAFANSSTSYYRDRAANM